MTNYVASSGEVVRMGGFPPIPAWVAAIPSREFTSLAPFGAATWNAGAGAVIPARAYRGTDPIGAILNAYGDPVFDPVAKKFYFFNGGHGDSSVNAVVSFDVATLSFALECDASPTSEYPPNYITGLNNYTLPSGLFLGNFFRPLDQLPNPIDQPYAAAIPKPVVDHRYGAQDVRSKEGVNPQIDYFWAVNKTYDLATHSWVFEPSFTEDRLQVVREVGARANIQTAGLGNNIGFTDQANHQLKEGTMALYDRATDRYLVTLVSGGWRYGFFIWEPSTRTCSRVVDNPGPGFQILEAMPLVQVGRWAYLFTSDVALTPDRVIDRGVRYNFDTGVIEYFTITGVTPVYEVSASTTQEGAPAWYSSVTNKIAIWNHNATDRQNIYELDVGALTTGGGSGTYASPYNWAMTKSALAGTAPSSVSYRYRVYEVYPGVVMIFPHSTSAPIVIKI